MLQDFQRSFAAGLLQGKMNGAVPDGLRVDALGFGVHALNAQESLKIAVENAFPVTKHLVGADFFAEMSRQFVTNHPPTNGWLSAYGAGFPHFVAQYRPAGDLDYLPDVARIEWARVRAANAADEPGLDLKALAATASEFLNSLHLMLHVAASLVSSPFPVFDIWRAHQDEDRDKQLAQINLEKETQTVLISRSGTMETVVTLLGLGDAAFLIAVMGHLPFGVACERALMAEPNYDLVSGLGNLVIMRALSAVPERVTSRHGSPEVEQK